MNGAFFIDKEAGCTSRDVVNEIIKKVETNKVGHTGTLDPMATGVLVVCVGKATKLVNLITSERKTYEAEVTLGLSTDTYDITGNIIEKKQINEVSEEEIRNVLDSFIGEYEQEVPIYSAVKVDGKKLYEYARENKIVKLPKRIVSIYDIKLTSSIKNIDGLIKFDFIVTVSKGTYIRSLIKDIAYRLNTIGVMSFLRRVDIGNVSIDECVTIDNLKISDLVSTKQLLKDYKQIKVDEILKKDILNGKIIENIYTEEKVVFLDQSEKVLAIYKTYEKDITKMKPEVMLGGI